MFSFSGTKTENWRYTENKYHPRTFAETTPGPGCSKLTTSLVNISLKFQTLISNISKYFLLKKSEKLLQKLLPFFPQKLPMYLVIKW